MITPRLSIHTSFAFGLGLWFAGGKNMYGRNIMGLTLLILWWEVYIGAEAYKRF
jgi:hypothetical protein